MYISHTSWRKRTSHCTIRQSCIAVADAWESQRAWARANCQNQARFGVEIMHAYPVILERDADYIMATSPDFPELTTFGNDRDEALRRAVDAFEEAIAARIYDGRDIPKPSDGKPIVELPIVTAKKVMAYQSNDISVRTHTTPRQNWTREQELAVLYLKVEIGKSGLTQKHPTIDNLAKAMGRTNNAIWMRKCNFDALDNSVPGVGLSKVSNTWTKPVWDEYQSNPDTTIAKARKAYLKLVNGTG